MYGIRWLPAVAVAFAACIATPDAHAQTWLRWGKAPAREQTDPSKQVASPQRRTVTVPVVPPSQRQTNAEPVAATTGPSVTIIEDARPAVASITPATLARPLPAPKAERVPAASQPVQQASVQPAPRPVVASLTPPAMPRVSQAISTTVAAPATLSPPLPVPVAIHESATATPLLIEEAAVESAPLAVAAAAAPPPPAALCSDCPTMDELRATSNAIDPTAIAPEDQKIQSEIKRRALQVR